MVLTEKLLEIAFHVGISIGDSFAHDHSCNLVYQQCFERRHDNDLLCCQDLVPVGGLPQQYLKLLACVEQDQLLDH